MEGIIEIIRTDKFLIVLVASVFVMFILYVINSIRLRKIRKDYKKFMDKIGEGVNIEEILEKHIDRINQTITKNDEIEKMCERIDSDMKNCIQKVGIYRYNAYKDAGNELSFAVALLDEENRGVVFNGIYSKEMSNIYAKPIEKGNSLYKITEEENEAIRRAVNS